MVVNYSLTIKNSSRARNVIAGADSQVVVQHEGDELVFQRESLFQCFAKVGKRLLKLKIVIVIDSVLQRGIVSAGCWLQATDRVYWPLNTALSLPFRG